MNVMFDPFFLSQVAGLCMQGCSIVDIAMCTLFMPCWKAWHFSTMLFASVAFPVNIISLFSAFINLASVVRDSSNARFASIPKVFNDSALPYFVVKYGIIASKTRGSSGVVAA